MLPRSTSLRDIDDVEAFVIMCIKRSGAPVQPNEYEELVAEGICILYQMEKKYIPRMDGYARDGRFSGYAVKWMPRKMKEAWHRMNENAQQVTIEGKRRWVYYERAASWDALTDSARNEHHFDETQLRNPGDFTAIPIREK